MKENKIKLFIRWCLFIYNQQTYKRNFNFDYLFFLSQHTILQLLITIRNLQLIIKVIIYSIIASIINYKKNKKLNFNFNVLNKIVLKYIFLVTIDVFNNLYTGTFKDYIIHILVL